MNENEFSNRVMPRAQLSMMASQRAVDKATQKNATEFAGFEVLQDKGTPVPPLNNDGKAFIEKLKSAARNEFDKPYMQAQLTNHEYLREGNGNEELICR
jgi:hypothetical protein